MEPQGMEPQGMEPQGMARAWLRGTGESERVSERESKSLCVCERESMRQERERKDICSLTTCRGGDGRGGRASRAKHDGRSEATYEAVGSEWQGLVASGVGAKSGRAPR
eukprot:3744063-Pleurochrysis_carterae.AAC.5